MKIKNIRFLLVILLFFVLPISGCKSDVRRAKQIMNTKNEEIISKRFSVPDSMERYRPFKGYLLDSNNLLKENLKIYTLVDVSCSSCIQNIKNWNSLSNLFIKENVPVFMICQSKDRFELFKYFCESGKVDKFVFPFFLDKKGQFLKRNPFLANSTSYHTVLVDENDKILLVGDPTHSGEMFKKYITEIRKLSMNKEQAQ